MPKATSIPQRQHAINWEMPESGHVPKRPYSFRHFIFFRDPAFGAKVQGNLLEKARRCLCCQKMAAEPPRAETVGQHHIFWIKVELGQLFWCDDNCGNRKWNMAQAAYANLLAASPAFSAIH